MKGAVLDREKLDFFCAQANGHAPMKEVETMFAQ